MPTYAIGDVHGCRETLDRLLEEIHYDPDHDRLWLVGDLVNRGPDSRGVLRWAMEQGDRVVTVLGNHDLHLVSRVFEVRSDKPRDTFQSLLAERDLVEWLRQRPLLHRDGEYLLVHAGLLPTWTLATAEELARRIERELVGERARELLAGLYDRDTERWPADLSDSLRLAAALRAFVSIRTCTREGQLAPGYTGPPGGQPAGFAPWFDWRRTEPGVTVIFGHWAALGLYRTPGFVGLDTGCAWGGSLTAFRLEDGRIFQVPASETRGGSGRRRVP